TVFGAHEVLIPDGIGKRAAIPDVEGVASDRCAGSHFEIHDIGSRHFVADAVGGDPHCLVATQHIPTSQFDDWRKPYSVAAEELIAWADAVKQDIARKASRIWIGSCSHSSCSSDRMPERELRFNRHPGRHRLVIQQGWFNACMTCA